MARTRHVGTRTVGKKTRVIVEGEKIGDFKSKRVAQKIARFRRAGAR